jgi:peptidase S24-like protein
MTATDARGVARAGLLERYRSDGRTTWLEATGRSMDPLIPAGSQLLVEFGALPERIGDIVLFRRESGAVAHRVVARGQVGDRQMLVAKGDGEALADPPFSTDAVLGVVREVRLPDGRTANFAIARRRGAALGRVSWLSGRAARLGGHAAGRLPPRLRPGAIAATHALAGFPTRVFTALIPRLDRGASAERR